MFKKVILLGDPDCCSVQYPSCLIALNELQINTFLVFVAFFSVINEEK